MKHVWIALIGVCCLFGCVPETETPAGPAPKEGLAGAEATRKRSPEELKAVYEQLVKDSQAVLAAVEKDNWEKAIATADGLEAGVRGLGFGGMARDPQGQVLNRSKDMTIRAVNDNDKANAMIECNTVLAISSRLLNTAAPSTKSATLLIFSHARALSTLESKTAAFGEKATAEKISDAWAQIKDEVTKKDRESGRKIDAAVKALAANSDPKQTSAKSAAVALAIEKLARSDK